MSLAAARAFLQQKAMEDREAYEDEYDALMKQKNEQARRAGWGSMIGQWGLTALGVGAAALSGGALTPLAAAALGGIGTRVGSEIGEHMGGKGSIEDNLSLKKRSFGRDMRRKADKNLKDTWEGHDDAQWTKSIVDAGTTYMAAGGEITGTKEFDAAGGFGTVFQNPVNAAPGTAAFGLEKGMKLGDFIRGGKQWKAEQKFGDEFSGVDVYSLPKGMKVEEYEGLVGAAKGYVEPLDDWTAVDPGTLPVGMSQEEYEELVRQRQSQWDPSFDDPWV